MIKNSLIALFAGGVLERDSKPVQQAIPERAFRAPTDAEVERIIRQAKIHRSEVFWSMFRKAPKAAS